MIVSTTLPRGSASIWRRLLPFASVFLLCPAAFTQTTQGLITGRITDSRGAPLRDVAIQCERSADALREATAPLETKTSQSGDFTLPRLSPGNYRLRAEKAGYQAVEVYSLELAVAARLEITLTLTAFAELANAGWDLPVGDSGRSVIVRYFASDIDRMRMVRIRLMPAETTARGGTLSYVVDGRALETLPFQGRDPFTALVLQPGVTADNATGRGIGVSVSGSRPSSNSFLLDGGEYNDYWTTGPMSPLVPEAVQEYRISANNYSAEYGGTAGFVANAVTKVGGDDFHGVGYGYFARDVWNANEFQLNAEGNPRRSLEESRLGFSVQGPIRKRAAYFSSQLERYRHRGEEESKDLSFPVLERLKDCPSTSSIKPVAQKLLMDHPAPIGAVPQVDNPCSNLTVQRTITPQIPIDRILTMHRIDVRPRGSKASWAFRFASARGERRNFKFSPYEGFSSTFLQRATTFGVNHTYSQSPSLVNELRFTWRRQRVSWDRPHPEIPNLIVLDRTRTYLPRSPSDSGFDGRIPTWELSDSIVAVRGRHVFTFGAGALFRRPASELSFGRFGLYQFLSIGDFVSDNPIAFSTSVSLQSLSEGQVMQPDYESRYSNKELFFFGQDSFRVTKRVSVDLGLRYESHGAIRNTGPGQAYFQTGPGETIDEQLCGADKRTACTAEFLWDGTRSRVPYRADRNDLAARVGAAFRLFRGDDTVLRTGYGVFYDRPFGNLVDTSRNNLAIVSLVETRRGVAFSGGTRVTSLPFLTDIPTNLTGITSAAGSRKITGLPQDPVWIDENLRSPYVHSWFTSIEHTPVRNWSFSLSHTGNVGRKLFATDKLNRMCQIDLESSCLGDPGLGRPNPSFEDILYRANLTSSSYAALAATARYRGRRGFLQAAYTWSHSIDQQSDPLIGDFVDELFGDDAGQDVEPGKSAFTRQLQPRLDKASSDFDQRHNFVTYWAYDLPGDRLRGIKGMLLGGWRIAQLAAFRSGFPVRVLILGEDGRGDSILNNRPNLARGADGLLSPRTPAPDQAGVFTLSSDEFSYPDDDKVGSLGRNAIVGPGFWNVDLSISKIVRMTERLKVEIRADAFNAFNHVNLGEPDGLLFPPNDDPNPDFGLSRYGRLGRKFAFPSRPPLDETPRNIQLQLKFTF